MNFLKSLLSLVAPMAFLRFYAGGGDGGAGQMREDEKARDLKVQKAIDAINARFGIAPSGGTAQPPSAEQFMRPERMGFMASYASDASDPSYSPPQGAIFDEAGYNQALAEFNANKVDVQGAKAARDQQYTGIAQAVKDTAMRDLDRQYSKAAQTNKFGLARAGLMGGSVDAEAGGELQTLYGEGKLKATAAGDAAANELRTADEKTRQNLISLAQSGLDVGTASSLAAGQMGAAADLAKANANAASVGDMFSNMGQAYLINQSLKARQSALAPQQPTSYGSGSLWGKSYTGRVSA